MIIKNGKKVTNIIVGGKKVLKVYSGGQLVCSFSAPTPTTIGEFSVPGGKIGFAPGNLQYQASTGLWRFAEHQWDFVGNNSVGNVYENGVKCSNSLISSTYDGWIDLFGWGTSGYDNGQNAYEPYSSSTTSSDYYQSGLVNTADWGYSYGQQEGGTWNVMNANQWQYIFNGRQGNRFAKCQIDSQYNALILFPDNYNSSLNNINVSNSAFTSNQLTIQDAESLTNDGCVILLCVGNRNGTSIMNINNWGNYWLSKYDANGASYAIIGSSSVSQSSTKHLFMGYPVRLVQYLQ